MKADTEKARAKLAEGGLTCVFCRGEELITSEEKGLRPLLARINGGASLDGMCAADKVVGKAPALLYVLLGVSEVYAPVMSRAAAEVFERYNIPHGCGTVVDEILNADRSGLCPMERAVKSVETPEEGLARIKETIIAMRR